MKQTFRIAVMVALAGGLLLSRGLLAQASRTAEVQLKAAQHKEEVEGDLKGAIEQYKKLAQGGDRAIAAKALVRMGECYQKLGDAESRTIFERVVREFADQAESLALARTRLAALKSSDAAHVGPLARLIWNDLDQSEYNPEGLSADGRYVSFTDGASLREGDLAVLDLREGTTRHLTTTTSYRDGNAGPSLVSPDGRQVAYWWEVATAGFPFPGSDLRILPLSGDERGEPRVVHRSDETTYMEVFGWTPDGKSLLVLRQIRDLTWQIAVVSIADGSVRVLKSLEWRVPSKASLSPDGRFIAYDAPVSADLPARDVFLLAADGSRETVVVQNPANDEQPVWSPDGSQLLFVSNRTGNRGLWRVHIDAGKPIGAPELIKPDIGRMLGMTRNGTLYYVSGGPTMNIYTVDVDANMNVKTGPSLATGRFIDSNVAPGASPDGQYLAYVRQVPIVGSHTNEMSTEPSVIVIRSLKTGEEREVRPGLLAVSGPMRWFPDGRSMLVRSPNPQRTRLGFYRVDATSGRAELLLSVTTPTFPRARPADLSPDGKSIFYTDPSRRLMRFNVESRREAEFPAEGGLTGVMSVAVSPDSAQLAISQVASQQATSRSVWLEVMPVGGGEPRKVFRWSGPNGQVGVTWTPDQRYLLFVTDSVAGRRDQVQEVWRVPVTGGEAEKIGLSVKGRLGSLAPDPGGQRITYQANEDHAFELWALQNFLSAPSAKK